VPIGHRSVSLGFSPLAGNLQLKGVVAADADDFWEAKNGEWQAKIVTTRKCIAVPSPAAPVVILSHAHATCAYGEYIIDIASISQLIIAAGSVGEAARCEPRFTASVCCKSATSAAAISITADMH
jgi:hypothetical protein